MLYVSYVYYYVCARAAKKEDGKYGHILHTAHTHTHIRILEAHELAIVIATANSYIHMYKTTYIHSKLVSFII